MSLAFPPANSNERHADSARIATPETNAEAEAIRFILAFARALHTCGTPAHRLESALQACAERLGIQAQFFSTPTSMFASFGPADAQRTCLLRVEPGDVDLGRTTRLDTVLQSFLQLSRCKVVRPGRFRVVPAVWRGPTPLLIGCKNSSAGIVPGWPWG